MKRRTHIMLGAAMGTTIAASLSPGLALGAVWWGMVGGGFPDWLDLRSDYQHRLKHRGGSHSLLAGIALTAGFWLIMTMLTASVTVVPIAAAGVSAWTLAFGLGFLSHIVADACTVSGVQPWLPLSHRKWWLLPTLLRGRSVGPIDRISFILSAAVVAMNLIRYVSLQIPT